MKKVFFAAIAVLLCFASCEKESLETSKDTLTTLEQNTQSDTRGGASHYPSNEMVVQYDEGLSEAEKQALRDEYGVVHYKKCECADPTLELWILDFSQGQGTGGSIEEKVGVAKEDSDIEDADFNPDILHGGVKLQQPFGPANVDVAITKMVPSNQNVTIAILDTGIDYNYFGFTSPFLYNSMADGDYCVENDYKDIFGWDFVNQDNDAYDDHGHGTIGANQVYRRLEADQVHFQILPVKVFDANGKGSYFDILCGFKYAVNNDDVDVINMSFGWYADGYELLGRFIEESQDEVLITASAGNDMNNNDSTPHYPSSWEAYNIISVAAMANNDITVGLSTFSNFGPASVDIAADGENIPFYITPNELMYVSGTSYSSAIVAAAAGKAYEPGMSVQEHFVKVIADGIVHNNLNMLKYSSYLQY